MSRGDFASAYIIFICEFQFGSFKNHEWILTTADSI